METGRMLFRMGLVMAMTHLAGATATAADAGTKRFGVASKGEVVTATGGAVGEMDREDKQHGEASVRFTVTDVADQHAIGFALSELGGKGEIAEDWSVHFWLKLSKNPEPREWPLVLVDDQGRRATVPLANRAADLQWHSFSLPLAVLDTDKGFDFGTLRAIQWEAPLPEGTQIWIDHVYFYQPRSDDRAIVLE